MRYADAVSTDDTSSPPDGGGGAPTPEMIETFRQVGLRLDRSGRLWHKGHQVTHPRLKTTILRWLDRRERDGRPIIRLDDQRYAYIDVEDADLLVTSARWQGDRVFIVLNDGSEEELAYASLRVGESDALYCDARGGRLEARITTPAFYVLAERIDESDANEFELHAAGKRFPVGERRP